MKREEIIDITKVLTNANALKNNKGLESKRTLALILEKVSNQSVITNDFLQSITIEDIDLARSELVESEVDEDNNLLIKELQMNTFLETIIDKTKCLKTTDTEDFF